MAESPIGDRLDSAWLEAAIERLPAMLREALEDQESLLPEQVHDVMDAMSIGLEELLVAKEELATQAEDLGASQRVVQAERERYADLFEFAPDCYVETDHMGKIIEANSAAVHLFGVPGRGLVGKLVQSFVSAEHRREVRTAISALDAGGEMQDLSIELHPRVGLPRRTEIRIAGHADTDGAYSLRWLIRDVTEKIKVQHELEQLRASVDLLASLSRLDRLYPDDQHSVESVLARMVEAAFQILNIDCVANLADHPGGPLFVACGPVAEELGRVQQKHGGPAALTETDGDPRWVSVRKLDQWPDLADAARRCGILAIATEAISVDDAVVGSISLFACSDDGDATHWAKLLAECAGAWLTNGRAYRDARAQADNLARAMESRTTIEQAKGIIMSFQGCDADAAFDILRRASQRQNRRLRIVAQEIVDKASRSRRVAVAPEH
ncbi:MAG: ANTAR domain-containing protein [Acidimicrobiales bacterium]